MESKKTCIYLDTDTGGSYPTNILPGVFVNFSTFNDHSRIKFERHKTSDLSLEFVREQQTGLIMEALEH